METNVDEVSELVFEIIAKENVAFTSKKGMDTLFRFYSVKSILKRLRDKSNSFYLLRSMDRSFAGFGEFEGRHLVSLYIKQDKRNEGLGTRFISYASKEKQGETLTVYSSPISIEFYKKCGFVQDSINCIEKYGILYMPMVRYA